VGVSRLVRAQLYINFLLKGSVDVPQRSVRPYFWMLAGCGSFAIMSVLAHAAGERCNWQTVAFFRAFLVLIFVGSFSLATGTKLVFLRPGKLWVRSIAGSLSLVMAFFALSRLKASTVVTLSNTFPIWVAVLSWPLLGTLPSPRVWIAVLFGVIGVYLIQMPQAGGNEFAILLALTSAAATSIAMIGLHRLRGIDPNAVVVHFSAVATVAASTAFFVFEPRDDAMPFFAPEAIGLLLGVGLTASVGQMFLTRAFAHGDPAKVSIVGLSQVVFTLIIDVIFTDHRVTTTAMIGTLLVLAPTAWVMLERRRQHPSVPELVAPTTDLALAADPAEHDG
jgi:drug/metabolite transporter (DMT)-like permease